MLKEVYKYTLQYCGFRSLRTEGIAFGIGDEICRFWFE